MPVDPSALDCSEGAVSGLRVGGLVATQAVKRRVCRSRDAYIGGVCAGLAGYFDLDTIVVRILAILIIAMTLGLGVVAYLVLWARLPQEAEPTAPYEVRPESAESNALGCVDCSTGNAEGLFEGEGRGGVSMPARFAVAGCLFLLFLVVAISVSPLIPGTRWWQFWPAGLLIAGLCFIVIPIPTRFEAAWHAFGIAVTSVAVLMFPMSLGIVSWGTIPLAFSQAWPFVAAAVATFAIGVYKRIDALMVGSAFFIVAFCLFALLACPMPGEMDMLMLNMPDGQFVKIIVSR